MKYWTVEMRSPKPIAFKWRHFQSELILNVYAGIVNMVLATEIYKKWWQNGV